MRHENPSNFLAEEVFGLNNFQKQISSLEIQLFIHSGLIILFYYSNFLKIDSTS